MLQMLFYSSCLMRMYQNQSIFLFIIDEMTSDQVLSFWVDHQNGILIGCRRVRRQRSRVTTGHVAGISIDYDRREAQEILAAQRMLTTATIRIPQASEEASSARFSTFASLQMRRHVMCLEQFA